MQQSSINEKHTQAQSMWFQLLKKQKKNTKSIKTQLWSGQKGKEKVRTGESGPIPRKAETELIKEGS